MCWPKGAADRRYAGVTHIDVNALDDFALARIQSQLASTGVAISGLGYYPNLLTPDDEESKAGASHLKQVIRAAQTLKLPVVSTFIGRDWNRSVDDNWPRFRAVWPDLIKFAEDHGVRIAIENCPMLFTRDEWPGGKNLGSSPALWRKMFDEIPSPNFGLNYDPSHMVWQQMDYIKPLRDFRSRIFRVHLKDARVDQHRLDEVGILAHPLEYHSPKLPGLGDVNWGQFLSVLGDTGYDGPICVEVEDRAYEANLDARKRALVQSHNYIRQFITGEN
jgi:sugar phosphate isomerase/epimerase